MNQVKTKNLIDYKEATELMPHNVICAKVILSNSRILRLGSYS